MTGRLRVLVTGASGFIGQAVLRAIPPSWSVTAISRREGNALPPGVTRVTVPTTDPISSTVGGAFDTLIHLAGNANHGLAAEQPWSDIEATGQFGARILYGVQARRLVVLSSAAVYAGLTGLMKPNECVLPPMPYGLSKLYVEGLAASAVAVGRFQSAVIIRLYNAFGDGERPTRLIPRVVAAAREHRPFTLTGAPDSLSDPVHVDDVVRSLVASAALDLPVGSTRRFDLCGGDPRPLADQVARIASTLGYEVPAIEVHANPGEIPIRFWSDPRPTIDTLGLVGLEPFGDAVVRYGTAAGWS